MVVLESGGALLEPALALDGTAAACLERAYAQADVSLKLLPKRYINLHQWLSPVTTSPTSAAAVGKDLKLQIVSILFSDFNENFKRILASFTFFSGFFVPIHMILKSTMCNL